MRLVEREPEPEHPRPIAPARDDLLAIGALEIEMPEDAELVGVPAHRFDGENVDGLAERAGRMDHRAIDPGRGHLGQRIIDRKGRDLAMLRAHLAVLPELDLGIDDQHGVLLAAQLTSTRLYYGGSASNSSGGDRDQDPHAPPARPHHGNRARAATTRHGADRRRSR